MTCTIINFHIDTYATITLVLMTIMFFTGMLVEWSLLQKKKKKEDG